MPLAMGRGERFVRVVEVAVVLWLRRGRVGVGVGLPGPVGLVYPPAAGRRAIVKAAAAAAAG